MSGFDLSTLETTFLSRLGYTSWTDCNWFQKPELYDYFDEAAKRLGSMGLFADVDETVTLSANTAQYSTPTGWISTIACASQNGRLRPVTNVELEALDTNYATTPGNPARYSMDTGPLGTVTLYPLPTQNNTGEVLEQVYHRFPVDVTTSQTTVPVPAAVADYFLYFALERARARQSEASMPEAAAHFHERCQMWEQVFAHYWTEGDAE